MSPAKRQKFSFVWYINFKKKIGGIALKTVRTEKELANAIKSGEDMIIIEGDLANKTLKLKATGSFAWGIAFAAIVAAVGMMMTGVGLPAAMASAAGATAILGSSVTAAAISIAIAAGGSAILDALRDDYKIVEKSSNRVVLKR